MRRGDEMDEQVPAGLADVEVEDTDGGIHRLGEAWARRPVVLVWVRHFG
jgi:hypothetical protein